jgi:malate dehydrogenase
MTDDPKVAFDGVEYAFLVGAKPRSHGMLRSDLLQQNAAIFAVQGKALNDVASRDVKVLVTGNPSNTNALIAINNAPDLSSDCFTAMTMLDHTRAVSQLAQKCGVISKQIKNIIIWGNHSCMQYPDLHHARVNGFEALSLVDDAWFVDEFIPTVQHRGTEIIKVRGQSSAASAANAVIAHMRAWAHGTADGEWLSMAVLSDGSYGIEEGLVYSFPVTVTNGKVSIVKGLEINPFSLERLRRNETELKEERQAIKHLL